MHAHGSANPRQSKTAWVFVAGLSHDLTEGDVITVFSQYGEVVNINLPRHRETGKSRGFCFVCYQNLNSTTLAVENLNGITLLGRKLKVDYVDNYKAPKYSEHAEEELRRLWEEGCAPKPIQPAKRKEVSQKKHKFMQIEQNKFIGNEREKVGNHRIFEIRTIRKLRKDNQRSFAMKTEKFPEVNWRDIEIWKLIQNCNSRGEDPKKRMRKTEPERDTPYIPNRYL